MVVLDLGVVAVALASRSRERPAGFDMVFSALRGSPRPSNRDAEKVVLSQLNGAACVKGAEQVVWTTSVARAGRSHTCWRGFQWRRAIP